VIISISVVQELKTIVDRGQKSSRLATESDALQKELQDRDKIQDLLVKGKKSAQVLEVLREAFSAHRDRVCALSSKGNIMNTIDFMEEFDDAVLVSPSVNFFIEF